MAYKDMVLGTLTQTAINERDNTYFEMAQEVEEVYRKAKAWDKIVEYKHNIMAVKEISLTHATDEPFNTDMYSVHSLVDNLLDVIDELERTNDERWNWSNSNTTTHWITVN